MTIYGPASANYTDAVEPILMTDWNHRSGFQDWALWQDPKANKSGPIPMTNILLNGKGRYRAKKLPGRPERPIGQPERLKTIFSKGKSYLLRLINTSLDTAFVFTIDGHNLTVIGSDFVAIEPYNTTNVLIGIGWSPQTRHQRVHV